MAGKAKDYAAVLKKLNSAEKDLRKANGDAPTEAEKGCLRFIKQAQGWLRGYHAKLVAEEKVSVKKDLKDAKKAMAEAKKAEEEAEKERLAEEAERVEGEVLEETALDEAPLDEAP